MDVRRLLEVLRGPWIHDDVPIIIMTPEKDHYLTYKITEVKYSEELQAVIIDIQRSL